MGLELVRHARRGLDVGEEHERRRKPFALAGEDGEVEIVERDDEADVVLLAQSRERRDVFGIGDPRDDDAPVAVVERGRERIGVDAERDCAGGAERAGDVDPLADRREHHDHDARAYSEDSGTHGAKVSAVPEPIRILRVIARLNMGGPAIHVSNLAAGLETRGYHTTLVAGSLARGEDSMAYVAERLGVSVVERPGDPARGRAAARREVDPPPHGDHARGAAAHPAHAHRQGRRARPSRRPRRRAARARRSSSTRSTGTC